MRLKQPITVAPSADDTYRPPTDYEKAILNGLQLKPRGAVYQGYWKTRVVTYVDGTTFVLPDPREAQTARRRARNRVARRSRRVNRIRAAR